MSATDKGKQFSNRLLVQRFAAHLAHLLNTGNEIVELNLFAVYQALLKALSGAETRVGGTTYRDGLVGYRLVSAGASPDEIAQRYFEQVLDRPLQLARDNMFHKGHALFRANCRRGHEDWENAELARHGSDAFPISTILQSAPADFAAVRDRLKKLDQSISPGNPAILARERYGPIQLQVNNASAEVAEEMSVWGAISCSPLKLKKLADGSEFNSYCSLVIQAVETANAHYGAILTLGFSPFDWDDELSINTAKKVSAFWTEAKALKDHQGTNDHTLDGWRGIWTQRQVPGFKTADEFWKSELGRQLRRPVVVRPGDADIQDIPDETDFEAKFLEEESFREMVTFYERNGKLESYDAWLLGELFEGAKLRDLKDAPESKAHLGARKIDLEAYAEELLLRVLAFVRQDSS